MVPFLSYFLFGIGIFIYVIAIVLFITPMIRPGLGSSWLLFVLGIILGAISLVIMKSYPFLIILYAFVAFISFGSLVYSFLRCYLPSSRSSPNSILNRFTSSVTCMSPYDSEFSGINGFQNDRYYYGYCQPYHEFSYLQNEEINRFDDIQPPTKPKRVLIHKKNKSKYTKYT